MSNIRIGVFFVAVLAALAFEPGAAFAEGIAADSVRSDAAAVEAS